MGLANEGLWPALHLAAHATALPRRGLGRLRRGHRSSPRRCARKPTPTIPWYWCRKYLSPWPLRLIPRTLAPRHRHHLLAHPLAELGALGNLPLGARSCSKACSGSSILGFQTQLLTATTSSTRSIATRGASSRIGRKRPLV